MFLANTIIDIVLQSQLESLDKEHMHMLWICCGDEGEFLSSVQNESWMKVWQKMKDYVLISICDQDTCQQGIEILHNFLTCDTLKFQIYEVRTLLFNFQFRNVVRPI